MAEIRTVAVCYPQVPFFQGGAEALVSSLCRQLRGRGFEVCPVSVPFRWTPKDVLLDQCLSWRLLDLRESNGKAIDLVIATKFPSYVVQHPNKVTWLFHQFRQVYDLFGTPLSEFNHSPDDLGLREMIRRVDCRSLSESQRLFAISKNVAGRLRDFNGLEATPLYPPPPRHREFRTGESENYVLSVGRLDAAKRVDALLRAIPHTDSSLRFVIVGEGPEEESLRKLATRLGVDDRVDFRGHASFTETVSLYAHSLGVYFAPFLEDYGYVTVEAFLSEKPVITAPDSGGPLEFVEDGKTGVVVDLEPEKLGEQLRRLDANRSWAHALGRAGRERIRPIRWEPVLDALVGA
jgi:glycosyltransferase involved in cell wall biosynthesis